MLIRNNPQKLLSDDSLDNPIRIPMIIWRSSSSWIMIKRKSVARNRRRIRKCWKNRRSDWRITGFTAKIFGLFLSVSFSWFQSLFLRKPIFLKSLIFQKNSWNQPFLVTSERMDEFNTPCVLSFCLQQVKLDKSLARITNKIHRGIWKANDGLRG